MILYKIKLSPLPPPLFLFLIVFAKNTRREVSHSSPSSSLISNSIQLALMSSVDNNSVMNPAEGSSGSIIVDHQDPVHPQTAIAPLSRYESQKRRDWNTFCQYLRHRKPPVLISQCSYSHVLDFLRYLDQFGKTKVHLNGCAFFGQPDPPGPCSCPLQQAWGSLDALIGRLRAAYEENGGSPEMNPFGNGTIRLHLREVRDSQSKARGIPYKKKKKNKKKSQLKTVGNPTRTEPRQPAS